MKFWGTASPFCSCQARCEVSIYVNSIEIHSRHSFQHANLISAAYMRRYKDDDDPFWHRLVPHAEVAENPKILRKHGLVYQLNSI